MPLGHGRLDRLESGHRIRGSRRQLGDRNPALRRAVRAQREGVGEFLEVRGQVVPGQPESGPEVGDQGDRVRGPGHTVDVAANALLIDAPRVQCQDLGGERVVGRTVVGADRVPVPGQSLRDQEPLVAQFREDLAREPEAVNVPGLRDGQRCSAHGSGLDILDACGRVGQLGRIGDTRHLRGAAPAFGEAHKVLAKAVAQAGGLGADRVVAGHGESDRGVELVDVDVADVGLHHDPAMVNAVRMMCSITAAVKPGVRTSLGATSRCIPISPSAAT